MPNRLHNGHKLTRYRQIDHEQTTTSEAHRWYLRKAPPGDTAAFMASLLNTKTYNPRTYLRRRMEQEDTLAGSMHACSAHQDNVTPPVPERPSGTRGGRFGGALNG